MEANQDQKSIQSVPVQSWRHKSKIDLKRLICNRSWTGWQNEEAPDLWIGGRRLGLTGDGGRL